MPDPNQTIAYLSLEIGLSNDVPTYSGGLGVLAGDTIKAAADLGLPYAGVTLLYRDGYFRQSIEKGRQVENPVEWDPTKQMEELPPRVYVPIEGRTVMVRAYRRWVRGVNGHRVPVYFLDTDVPENTDADRAITHKLYGGGTDDRLKQEAVLAIGGSRMLRALTHDVSTYHMNEGHAFLITMELMSEQLSRFDAADITHAMIEHVRSKCVFTTHTPVPAGHDRFEIDQVERIVGKHPMLRHQELCGPSGMVNTTVVALNLSRYANGVARKHGEVSRAMFPGYRIDSVTNGVHAATWVAPAVAQRLDTACPMWRACNADLRMATTISDRDINAMRLEARLALHDAIVERGGPKLDPGRFTIGFARRSTAYKQPALLLDDLDRLRRINAEVCPIQIVYAGKAHPRDGEGKNIIERIHHAITELGDEVPVAFVPNYDMALAATMVAGVDLWLNNPTPPMEASGTSGMKAALNGVPSLSTLDGWWIEGHAEGVTGWSIVGDTREAMAASLYDKLETAILPVWKNAGRSGWASVARSCIALNGSHFTTERMLREYIQRAYLR